MCHINDKHILHILSQDRMLIYKSVRVSISLTHAVFFDVVDGESRFLTVASVITSFK